MAFDWPWVFILLPLPFALRLLQSGRSDAASIPVSNHLSAAIAQAREQRHANWQGIRKAVLWLAWIALLVALAQPWWRSGQEIRIASGRALMLAIDLSGSMEKRDMIIGAEPTDRLTAVKATASDFVENREGDRIGLVLYGDEAFVASPLTFDTTAVTNTIAEAAIGMAGRTTAIGDAIGLAIVKLRDDPAREKALILLSDGTNNSGSTEPEDAAELAKQFGVRIHTIALGSDGNDTARSTIDPSADLDVETLEAISKASDGRFFRAATMDALSDVYAEISKIEAAESETPPIAQQRDLRSIPMLVFIACMIALGWPSSWRRQSA